MSELDDQDDFYQEESFDNDKKIKPSPIKPKPKQDYNPNLKEKLDESYEIEENPSQNRGRESKNLKNDPKSGNVSQSRQDLEGEVRSAKRSSSRISERTKPGGREATPNASQATDSKQSLIDKNKRLKQELSLLAGELDHILEKEKQKRQQKYAHIEDDDEIKDRKSQVAKQQKEINRLKASITSVKNQLQNVYDNNNVVQKEDELLYLKKQIREIKTEFDGLQIINDKQNQALEDYKDNGQYASNVRKLRETLAQVKEDFKKLSEQVIEQEREMRKQHEQLVNKEDNIRQLTERINEKKKGGNGAAQSQMGDEEITDKDIEEIEEKIKEQEQKRKQLEKQFQDRLGHLQKEKKELFSEQAKKVTILKSKEKELKLNHIKLREVEKYIKTLNQKEDTKSIISENQQAERDHSKNGKPLKRPPIFHKKTPAPSNQSKSPEKKQFTSQGEQAKEISIQVVSDQRGRPKEKATSHSQTQQKHKKCNDSQQLFDRVNDLTPKSHASKQPEKKQEEEIDLDEVDNYGNDFEEAQSVQISQQGNRNNSGRLSNDDFRPQSKESKQRPSEINDSELKENREEEEEEDKEQKEEVQENVFSKPSFMLKKKK